MSMTMSDRPGGRPPLSVRRGKRAPFEFVEGIPEHARPIINTWLHDVLYAGETRRNVRTLVSALRLPFQASYTEDLISGLSQDDDLYLDTLDFITFTLPQHREPLDLHLRVAGSAWHVDLTDGGLRRVVPDEALETYKKALDTAPSAAQHLSGAWEHAFGRHPDAGDAWGDAIRAVEAALHQIISPAHAKATLGSMKSELRQAPEGKFIIRDAGADPKDTLLGMLEAVPYENGRHGTDRSRADLATARIVVFQATALVAAVGEGLIERADAENIEGES